VNPVQRMNVRRTVREELTRPPTGSNRTSRPFEPASIQRTSSVFAKPRKTRTSGGIGPFARAPGRFKRSKREPVDVPADGPPAASCVGTAELTAGQESTTEGDASGSSRRRGSRIGTPPLDRALSDEARPPARSSHGDPKIKRVLVVEDDRSQRILLQRLIKNNTGITAEVAASDQAARRIISDAIERGEQNFDVIVLDCYLPEFEESVYEQKLNFDFPQFVRRNMPLSAILLVSSWFPPSTMSLDSASSQLEPRLESFVRICAGNRPLQDCCFPKEEPRRLADAVRRELGMLTADSHSDPPASNKADAPSNPENDTVFFGKEVAQMPVKDDFKPSLTLLGDNYPSLQEVMDADTDAWLPSLDEIASATRILFEAADGEFGACADKLVDRIKIALPEALVVEARSSKGALETIERLDRNNLYFHITVLSRIPDVSSDEVAKLAPAVRSLIIGGSGPIVQAVDGADATTLQAKLLQFAERGTGSSRLYLLAARDWEKCAEEVIRHAVSDEVDRRLTRVFGDPNVRISTRQPWAAVNGDRLWAGFCLTQELSALASYIREWYPHLRPTVRHRAGKLFPGIGPG
jgi:hypothetical protein